MITIVHGDILQTQARALVNPVNTEGVMGAGLALAFKRRFPAMFAEYRAMCLDKRLDIGDLHFYEPKDGPLIINFPTKRLWRNPSRIEYITAGMGRLLEVIEDYQLPSLAIPALGCGKGGLNWKDVSAILVAALAPLSTECFLYPPQ